MEIKPQDLINAKEALRPIPRPKLKQQIDIPISKIVGKTVLANDPRLLGLIVDYKKRKSNQDSQDNFLNNPQFIKDLKKLYGCS